MFKENHPSSYIAKVLQCDVSYVSYVITAHLSDKVVTYNPELKVHVDPFVLITFDLKVKEAYNRMINPINKCVDY